MKTFRITVGVVSASGFQSYTVRAKNEQQAIELFEAGEAEFEDEEVEVTSIDEPEVEEAED